MDLPIFHMDLLNNRILIALIAILHVIVNHAMAVGGIPLVAYLEHRGYVDGEPEWDRLAHRVLTCFFIVTTTVGALTGVGIWLSASLVNPYAIGSLLRVFFWAWFVEWLVFVTEVALILAYYLTWKRWGAERKRQHVRLGWLLSIASWLTMAIIVAILSFMMDPGSWRSDRSLLSGLLNPLYLPQLAFRTPLAMVMAGAAGLALVPWTMQRGSALRAEAARTLSRWILAWTAPLLVGGAWYARTVPQAMKAQLPTALLTQTLERWGHTAMWVLAATGLATVLVAMLGALRPRAILSGLLVVPAALSLLLVGTFERVREFIRKPYAIADYLYSNGIRKADYPLLQRDGLLAHATYTSVRTITENNELEAGREVFKLACSRCHTVDGVNGIRGVLERLYGDDIPWERGGLATYLGTMHNVRPYMPPFPGSNREREALASYLVQLQTHRDFIEGAQSVGVAMAQKVEGR